MDQLFISSEAVAGCLFIQINIDAIIPLVKVDAVVVIVVVVVVNAVAYIMPCHAALNS